MLRGANIHTTENLLLRAPACLLSVYYEFIIIFLPPPYHSRLMHFFRGGQMILVPS